MSFSAHSVEVVGETRDGVRLKITGAQSLDQGQYTGERNAEKTITVSKHKARSIYEDLDDIFGGDEE